jgi:hypothetical protein
LLNIPPEDAQTPIARTHFGSAIWSYTWRSTGAIFWLTRPATIMRSAWRGVAENRSMPNLAMSKRGPAVAIISMAQQASPNVAGHSEPLRT